MTRYPDQLRVPTTDGSEIEIPDPERFCDHLKEFHKTGVSIHTERGYAFRVDETFRRLVQDQVPGVVGLFD